MASNADAAAPSGDAARTVTRKFPRDAVVVINVLRSMGVEEWEPRVVNMLMEFIHRYTCEVIEEAQVYMDHRSGEEVNLDDVKLAIHGILQSQFVKPPNADAMHLFAQSLNRTPLPPLNNRPGIHVPQDDNLLGAHYEYFPRDTPLVDPDEADVDDDRETAIGTGGGAARAEAAPAEPTEMGDGGVEGFKVKKAKK